MGKVYRHPAAHRDLIAHYVYLFDNGGEITADRFLANAESSFDDLAIRPKIGAPLTSRHPDFAEIRKWRVKNFDNFLIFYLPRPDGVSIVRVLYAAQDWWNLLGIDA